ncbi:hypothetical protein MCEMSEM18_00317 [Comamonadaceae bacterium]
MILRKMAGYFVAGLLIAVTTGCATQAPTLDFVPKDVIATGKKIDFELKTISVSIAKEDERQGETQVGLFGNQYESSFKQSFKDAIEEALSKSAIFNDLSTRKLSLSAKVLRFESPSMGINFDTQCTVRYQLLDRSTGKLLFTRDVKSVGTVPFDYAFIGMIRLAEARNRAVRQNVEQLVQSLSEFQDPGK